MKTLLLNYLICILLCLLAAACKKTTTVSGNNNTGNNAVTDYPKDPNAIKTPVGTPTGTATTQNVDASGGTVLSADGILHVIIPAGALSSPTNISIQPITNELPDKIYNGYSLTPDGQQFQKPITLEFHYRNQDLDTIDAGGLTVAFQLSDDTWEAYLDPVIDTIRKTITVQTKHFTDWNILFSNKLSPEYDSVQVGKTLEITHKTSVQDSSGDPELAPPTQFITHSCYASDIWTVNDIPQGNSEFGTITNPTEGESVATFFAPGEVPNPSTVTVRKIWKLLGITHIKLILSSRIKILPETQSYHVKLSYNHELDESGSYWNWTDQGSFDVVIKGLTGTVEKISNANAGMRLDSNTTTCTYSLISSPEGPINIVDSNTVGVNPFSNTVTIVFSNLSSIHYIQDPIFGYICPGGTPAQLGGGYGPPFPSYIQFTMSDQTQNIDIGAGFTMTVIKQ